MRKSRFTDEQVVAMLEQIAAGPHGPAAERAANRLMREDWSETA